MKTLRTIMTMVLILALITVSTTTAAAVHCDCGDICVNENGWWRDGGTLNMSTTPIQAAVNIACSGETIFVYNGSYSENINIGTASLTLTGEGADLVTVTAASNLSHVFKVRGDYINISGFTTTGAAKSGNAGIYLYRVDQCNIHNNTASNNIHGIYLCLSSSNTLENNNASSNSNNGIYLSLSSSNTLANNNASSNYNGIYLSRSSNNIIMSNTASSNHWHGVYLSTSNNNNTLMNNTVCSNSQNGIHLTLSSSNMLANNIASSNRNGIYLSSSSNNTIMSSTASSNYWRGVYLSSLSNSNTLTNNTVCSNNDCGIFLYQKTNNLIYNNYFNNTNNARDEGVNTWNTSMTTGPNIIGGPHIGGNYWSNYTGSDNDSNGIGDTPYNITGGLNKDYLPLVYIQIVCGDIDGSGVVNSTDLQLLLDHVFTGSLITNECAGDVDGSGNINILDVRLLMNYLSNPAEYPLNCTC